MLKPILEVYIVWHPADTAGAAIANEMAEHFHGSAYTSLLSGAMEVYMRSAGWTEDGAAPRPILWPVASAEEADVIEPAEFVAVVPLVGTALNRAVMRNPDWAGYFEAVQEKVKAGNDHVRVFPIRINEINAEIALADLLPANVQYAGEQDGHGEQHEPKNQVRCRDLAQFIAQWISPQDNDQLQVFISHTKRLGTPEEPVAMLVNDVRDAFNTGRVDAFYDAHDLKPGDDWDGALRRNAATSALMGLRTDLYATREWCQREMLLAKTHGMPVVVLDALTSGESRGSFLMDHTPRIPIRRDSDGHFSATAIRRAINLLADAWLQRALWKWLAMQAKRLPQFAEYWWAPQAPEPCTLTRWLRAQPGADGSPSDSGTSFNASDSEPCIPPLPKGSPVRILHPDPPLSQDERRVLQQLVSLAGLGALDLTTPRLLAARGA